MPEPRTPMSMSPEPPSDPKHRGAALYRLLASLSPASRSARSATRTASKRLPRPGWPTTGPRCKAGSPQSSGRAAVGSTPIFSVTPIARRTQATLPPSPPQINAAAPFAPPPSWRSKRASRAKRSCAPASRLGPMRFLKRGQPLTPTLSPQAGRGGALHGRDWQSLIQRSGKEKMWRKLCRVFPLPACGERDRVRGPFTRAFAIAPSSARRRRGRGSPSTMLSLGTCRPSPPI